MNSTSKMPSCSSANEDCDVQLNDEINSSTSRYLVQDFIGKGAFGKVAKSVNLTTAKAVALKIVVAKDKRASKREIKMLQTIRALDPAGSNVVEFFEAFEHKGLTCLAFEMLDRDLFQLLMERQERPLSLNEIRPIAQQLLTAFEALKGIGVIYADLKPDNIMLVNHETQPFRVKLIDFGLSLQTSEVRTGLLTQAIGYRAPEVILGLPFTEAIDMWGLGCVLSLLFLSCHLFGIHCEYQQMRNIVDVLGQPDDRLLDAGIFTKKFFSVNRHLDRKWWLKSPMEYKKATGVEPKKCERALNKLDDIVTLVPDIEECIELEDRKAFVSLLSGLLHTDQNQRITPEKALKHPFITMVHLEEEADSSMYVEESHYKMTLGQSEGLNEDLKFDPEPEEPPTTDNTSASLHPGPVEPAPPGFCAECPPSFHKSAVDHHVVEVNLKETEQPTKEAAASDVRKSPLKRMRKFFSRVIRTVFRTRRMS
ncbi:homeodomain-interacting protein kinase 1-like [Xyrichtys novacula]|uniref:Homeodomain-interacting protein kinase 1-like n=1 Tax=Xyrichtys novacula TaxID=13765 RepID=A0AAV1EKP1_XYRNO|nr:homeodomain-interacting protein kinase 1-like [Xyrichtys novacula]